jgi:hypothetical protein
VIRPLSRASESVPKTLIAGCHFSEKFTHGIVARNPQMRLRDLHPSRRQ